MGCISLGEEYNLFFRLKEFGLFKKNEKEDLKK